MALGRRKRRATAPETAAPTAENRWCERHGYRIDLAACHARAERQAACRRCLARWRQLPLPFPEPSRTAD